MEAKYNRDASCAVPVPASTNRFDAIFGDTLARGRIGTENRTITRLSRKLTSRLSYMAASEKCTIQRLDCFIINYARTETHTAVEAVQEDAKWQSPICSR